MLLQLTQYQDCCSPQVDGPFLDESLPIVLCSLACHDVACVASATAPCRTRVQCRDTLCQVLGSLLLDHDTAACVVLSFGVMPGWCCFLRVTLRHSKTGWVSQQSLGGLTLCKQTASLANRAWPATTSKQAAV